MPLSRDNITASKATEIFDVCANSIVRNRNRVHFIGGCLFNASDDTTTGESFVAKTRVLESGGVSGPDVEIDLPDLVRRVRRMSALMDGRQLVRPCYQFVDDSSAVWAPCRNSLHLVFYSTMSADDPKLSQNERDNFVEDFQSTFRANYERLRRLLRLLHSLRTGINFEDRDLEELQRAAADIDGGHYN